MSDYQSAATLQKSVCAISFPKSTRFQSYTKLLTFTN